MFLLLHLNLQFLMNLKILNYLMFLRFGLNLKYQLLLRNLQFL
jgi:hypothetical protein